MLGQLRRTAPHLGWGGALSFYLRGKFAGGPYPVTPPGHAHAMFLRPRSSDRNMFTDVFIGEEYGFPLPRDPKVIVDGGANVGCTSVYFAHRFPDARIVAVEPEPSNFALLERNTAPYPNVRCVRAGLWPRTTHLVIENPDDVHSGFRVTESDGPVPGSFPAVTLTDLLAREGLDTVDILKIDVEGAERDLFTDPARDAWLSRARQLVVELHDRFKPGCTDAVEAAIAARPHRRHRRGENLIVDFED